MKFGGTSVGKPERMFQVRDLITRDNEPKIVVLSALSGTTNALVSIGDALAAGDKEKAKNTIDALHAHYGVFINALLEKEAISAKAVACINEHFEFLNIILKISFSEALSKDILAQGELLSTKLFCVYLEEIDVEHELLPALEFMSIDSYDVFTQWMTCTTDNIDAVPLDQLDQAVYRCDPSDMTTPVNYDFTNESLQLISTIFEGESVSWVIMQFKYDYEAGIFDELAAEYEEVDSVLKGTKELVDDYDNYYKDIANSIEGNVSMVFKNRCFSNKI